MSAVVRPQDREGFALHAAPEAIAAGLEEATGRLRVAAVEIAWLSDLLAARTRQVLNGEWPPPPTVGAPDAA